MSTFDSRLKKLVSLIPLPAHSVIGKDDSQDVEAIPIAASQVLGRTASSKLKGLTMAELATLLGEIGAANNALIVFDVTLGTGDDQHVVMPAGTVTKVSSVIHGALATADETLTFKNNAGTGLTGGVLTITQVGSADGDIDSDDPSANNVFTAGQKLTVTIGGENTNAVVARITVEVDLS